MSAFVGPILNNDTINNAVFSFIKGQTDYNPIDSLNKSVKSKKSGATIKGYMKNLNTGVVKEFQFNPSPPFQYSRGATYATIESPGQSYPLTSFVKGNLRTFSMALFLFDKPYTGLIDKDYMQFYGGLLTPETNTANYVCPPKFILSYGFFTRTCVLEDLDISIDEYDALLRPVKATMTLSIRQEGV